MSLDDLTDAVEETYEDLEEDGALDRETRTELAMLVAAFDPDDSGDLLRRGVHLLFQSAVDTGKLDFHLRSQYDTTYDEYLAGTSYDDMAGGTEFPGTDDDARRYQF